MVADAEPSAAIEPASAAVALSCYAALVALDPRPRGRPTRDVKTSPTVTSPAQPARPRRLETKLASIAAGRYTPADFILADAKDADMAFGVAAPGPMPGTPAEGSGRPGHYRTRHAYLEAMRAGILGGALDIMLTSASNGRAIDRGWLARSGRDARGARQ